MKEKEEEEGGHEGREGRVGMGVCMSRCRRRGTRGLYRLMEGMGGDEVRGGTARDQGRQEAGRSWGFPCYTWYTVTYGSIAYNAVHLLRKIRMLEQIRGVRRSSLCSSNVCSRL
jgi:hypothetical protein